MPTYANPEEVDENSVKCDGCNLMVHYSKMMKTHQLGGNTRKETRCPTCHEDYQMGVYAAQMLESLYTCSSNLDRFGNWAENEEVKTAILQLLEKGIEQLGLTMRAVHAEKVVDAESGDGAVAAAEQKDADGESGRAWLVLKLQALMKLEYLEGKALHDWDQRIWAAAYFIAAGAFVFIAVPLGTSWESTELSVLRWVAICAGFAVISVAAWFLFRVMPEHRRRTEDRESVDA